MLLKKDEFTAFAMEDALVFSRVRHSMPCDIIIAPPKNTSPKVSKTAETYCTVWGWGVFSVETAEQTRAGL